MAPFPATHTRTSSVRIGPYQLKNNLFVAPMAGVTDRPFRQLCKRFGAGMAVSEMVASQFAAVGQREDAAPRQPRGRGRPDLGADRRRRSGDDGRGRALQRRPGRADHRHQHGLPGEESLQRDGRLGAAEGRTAGRAHPRGRGRRGRRAGDAQVPHRLGPRSSTWKRSSKLRTTGS